MAKKVRAIVKILLQAGQATPAPPVGPALGQHGCNIMQFVKEYNDRTASMAGSVVPVQLTVFEDRSFSFITKTSPASELIKQQAKVEKGSATAGKAKIGTVDRESVRRIAQTKLADLNSNDIEGAMRMIEGTARSMGIEVVESHDKGAKSA